MFSAFFPQAHSLCHPSLSRRSRVLKTRHSPLFSNLRTKNTSVDSSPFGFSKNFVTVTTEFSEISFSCPIQLGTAVAQWLRCCATNRKVAGSIPAGVSAFFIDIKSFRSHYGPGVDSASNRNEYQEHFLGVKATGA